jgi:twitching motility two-component system response regulator PilG
MFSTAIFSSRTSAKHQLLLREAVAAIKKGERTVARTLLREIVHSDPRNAQAWLWMAGVAESVAEVTHCLEKVLEADPSNQMANERLSMLRLLRYTHSDGTGAAPRPNQPQSPAPAGPSAAVAVRGTGSLTVPGSGASPTTHLPAPRLKPSPYAAPTICVLCQSDIDVRKHQCGRCGALVSLRSMQDLFANRATDPQLIRTGVERWKVEYDKQPTPESSFALAIGYLNLHDFQKSVEYLQAAHRLSPDRKDLFEALDKLDRCPVVLVVDDSATIRHLVALTLHTAGYIVRMAEDGVKALSMLQDGIPDLVLMDINMPRMDGYQVCKVIKGDEATKRVPVVMLSGKDGFFDKVKGRLAGSSEYITKPFDADSLVRSVEKHVPSHKRGGVDRIPAAR